MREPGPR